MSSWRYPLKRRDSIISIAAAIALSLSLGLAACNASSPSDASGDGDQLEEAVDTADEADGTEAEISLENPAPQAGDEDAALQERGADDTKSPAQTPEDADGSASGFGAESNMTIVREVQSDQELLSEEQRNSLSMLNYLSVMAENVSSSRHSRLALEEAYSTLINNTNPSAVDDRTQAQIENLLDTIEGYRMVEVKRERLEYIYEQNQAQAMRSAIPNPLGLLSAVQSGNLAELAFSVVYMAVDSYTSYQSASSAAQLQYLQDGWELDDAEEAILHDQRKMAFNYMVGTVRDNDIPGYLTLSPDAIEEFVEWAGNENVVRRIRFLEQNEDRYKAYGGYWIALSSSYFENEDWQGCIDALATYETLRSDILRLDYDYARSIPAAIVSASYTMSNDEYVAYAESHTKAILDNCGNSEWELRYFVAQTYIDLYGRTGNGEYLQSAYDLAYDNVNYLLDKQTEMNEQYLAPIEKAPVPDGATKEQKKEVEQYNKMMAEIRKTELPPIYEPLRLNCDLLFALADELGIPEAERATIDGMLHPGGAALFLTAPLDNRYRHSPAAGKAGSVDSISFDETKLTIPADMLSESTVIEVSSNGKTVPGTWEVKKVKRGTESDISSFIVTIENRDAKGSFSDGDIVTITLTEGEGDNATVTEIRFKVTVEDGLFLLPDSIEFERI